MLYLSCASPKPRLNTSKLKTASNNSRENNLIKPTHNIILTNRHLSLTLIKGQFLFHIKKVKSAQNHPCRFEVITGFVFFDKRGFTQKWFYLFSPWILFTDIVRNSFDPLPHYGHCPCICRFLFKTRSLRKASKNGIYVYNQKEGNGKRSPAVPQ